MKRFSKFIQESVDLDEAVKIGSKVRIHAPGKDYHGKVGHVGEIRRGAFAKAPPSYTIDYREPGEDRNRSVMLPKEKIKLHKESVELDEASKKIEIPKALYNTILKGHGPKKLVRTPKGEMQHRASEYFAHDKATDTHITQTYSHRDHDIATIEKHTHGPSGKVTHYMYSKAKNEEAELDEAVEVSHDRYMRSHGKKPSGGEGSWMFTHKRMGDANVNDPKEVHSAPRGKFSDAKKSAQQWAKKNGHSTIYVMEEADLDEASYRDSGYRNMLKASQKADKEADKIRAQAAKKKPVKEEVDIDEAYSDAHRAKMAKSYKGKNPHHINALSSDKGTMTIVTNNGSKYSVTARETGGKMPKPGDHINKWKPGIVKEEVDLDEVYQETANYLVSEGIELESLNEEQLDELIGAVARGLKSTVVNKKGNFRFSTAGRADAAQKTADATKRKSDNIERLRKQRERLAKERERLQRLRQARNT